MSNYSETFISVYNYLKSRTPFVVIESIEPARVEKMLVEVSKKLTLSFDSYSELNGFYNIKDRSNRDSDVDPLVYLAERLRKQSSGVFVLNDIRYLNSDTAYSRQLLSLIYLAKERGCSIVLVSADSVWERLIQNGLYVKLDLPSLEERVELIREFVMEHEKKCHNLGNEGIVYIAKMLGGMSSQQIEMTLMSALSTTDGLTADSLDQISKNKMSIYGRLPSISEVRTNTNVYVSGLSRLKEWLGEKKKVFFSSDEQLKRRNLSPPKGILLCGIPGCGKSLSAKMISNEWQMPLYRFDIDNVLNKYVGESEKNMRTALEYIDNVSPCILWVDEIEKMLNVSDEGNETSKRILGQFLYWMQESTSRVFLVATANQVDMLPPELFRNGRFSERFFLDLPTNKEREEAIKLYFSLCLLCEPDDKQLETLVSVSEGFSYADIETAIKNMAEIMMINELEELDFDMLLTCFSQVVSTYKANPEMVRKNREWGKNGAINASK